MKAVKDNILMVSARNEQWTVDSFWEVDCPQHQQTHQEHQPGSSAQHNEQKYQEYIPMEEGEIESDKDQYPSI